MSELHDTAVAITGIGPIAPRVSTGADLLAASSGPAFLPEDEEGAWFNPSVFLGPKGFKYFTPATRYLLSAYAQAFSDARLADGGYSGVERGVFVGTNFAVHRTLEEMDRIILEDGADELQPMLAPNFSVNIPASQISIKHKFQAFNLTLTEAMIAGLEAVILGAAAIRKGRARMVLAGATEDAPPPGVAELIGSPLVVPAACALTLETTGRAKEREAPIYGRITDGFLYFAGRHRSGGERLEDAIDRALRRMIPAAAGELAYAPLRCAHPLNHAVDRAARRSLEKRGISLSEVPFKGAGGELMSVSPLFALATTAAARRTGLAVATSPQGHIAMLAIEGGGGE